MTLAAPESPPSLVEDALRRILAEGVVLTEDVLGFMEATFGDASPDALQAQLNDESDTERDALLDLIFFPDHTLQTAIEPILETHTLTEADVTLLTRRCMAKPIATRLCFSGAEDAIQTNLPASGVDAFLNRLHLTWQPVPALDKVLNRLDTRPLSPAGDLCEGRHLLRIRLRDAALRQTPVQVRFLMDFFEALPIDGEAFVDQLDFSLVFMKEHEDAANLYEALMVRKRFIFRHLMKARRSDEIAARSNMETLMMTGVRSPYFDVAQGQRTLAMIDTIALAVYGRTEMMEEALRDEDLGDRAETLDPGELIRRLS